MSVLQPDEHPAGRETGTPLGVIGKYNLLERLGGGGLGEVFRARDTVHGRTVLLKRVPAALTADAARLDALRRTARTLERISHPAVATLYELAEHDGEHVLSQEFVPGQTLAEFLAGRAIHPRRATEIALEVAEGLAAVHDAGALHGDLRPANVYVTPKGHAKIVDAGLAAFTAGGSLGANAAARPGALPAGAAAHLQYLSPEQALGEGGDQRSDLFALGAVLYEMLAGRAPFAGAGPDEVLLAVVQATPLPPSTSNPAVPASLDRIVSRATAKSLDRRYGSAAEMAADLRSVMASFDADLARAPASEPVTGRSHRKAGWLIAAALLGGLALAWWQLAG